jgi:aminoglycoside phosphotransferase (APT) family kinase protein
MRSRSDPGPADEVLRQCLEPRIVEVCGAPVPITHIERHPSAASSSYAAEIVTVGLATGGELSFFLKDLATSRITKDHAEQRRERELAVYRDLLPASELGTARFEGSVWDEANGRFWLLLELVPGTPVRHCTLEAWVSAAAWLGRLHGFFAREAERVRTCDLLLRYDAAFLRSRAALAARAVARVSGPLADQLAPGVERYERAIPAMVDWPPTLTHGHYRPYNILVDATAEPTRICPVDWERAGLGPPLFDFAYLAEGFDSEHVDLLGAAYRHAAARHGLRVPDPLELRYLANAFRVQRMLSLLGSAAERGFAEAEVAKLVALVSGLSQDL